MLLPLNVSDAVALVEFDESKVAADVEDEARMKGRGFPAECFVGGSGARCDINDDDGP